MTSCQNWKDRLLDYCLGTHDASARREIESHLQGCRACSEALAELRARRERMDAGLLEVVRGAEPSADFRARVVAAAEARAARTGFLPAWAAALAGVAVLVLLVVLAGSRGPEADSALMAAQELSNWESPTEVLLRSPIEELLQSEPSLGQVYFSFESLPTGVGAENGGNNES